MADERLPGIDEFLLTLIVTVMYESPEMTAPQIAKRVSNRTARRVDRRSVEKMLTLLAGGVLSVSGVPPCQIVRLRRGGLLLRRSRWGLIAADAPASPPDGRGAPVPAQPYRPRLSGAAAAELIFRDDEPPTNALGKTA